MIIRLGLNFAAHLLAGAVIGALAVTAATTTALACCAVATPPARKPRVAGEAGAEGRGAV
jgi:hypothetical protein